MQNTIKNYLVRLVYDRTKRRRAVSILVVLSLLVTIGVFWQLKMTGITMAGDVYCGIEEHTHDESCIKRTLICGHTEVPDPYNAELPETDEPIELTGEAKLFEPAESIDLDVLGAELDENFTCIIPEGHVHSEECYETVIVEGEYVCGIDEHTHDENCNTTREVLTCTLEEHTHIDECYYTPEPVLVCASDEEGHEHTDECYSTPERELVCDKEEHAHDDECYITENVECELTEHVHDASCAKTETVLLCDVEENHIHNDDCCAVPETQTETEPVHVHTEECYQIEYVCEKEEHKHSVECYADANADLQTADEWEEDLPALTGNWAEDLVAVAQSQLGQKESERNYILADSVSGTEGERVKQGYTRYGAWYGNPYGDWSAMFAAFCLHYADIPDEAVSYNSGVNAMLVEANNMALLADVDYIPVPGDIIFFDRDANGSAESVGIVSAADDDTVWVICGDVDGEAAEIEADFASIAGVVSLDAAYEAYVEIYGEPEPVETEPETEADETEPEETEAEETEPTEETEPVSPAMPNEPVESADIHIEVTFNETEEGKTIVLEAVMNGMDASEYLWQWQTSDSGLENWTDMEGETSLTCTIPATEENLTAYYRICGIKQETTGSQGRVMIVTLSADGLGGAIPDTGFDYDVTIDETTETPDTPEEDIYIVSSPVSPTANETDVPEKEPDKYYVYFYDFARIGESGNEVQAVLHTSDPIDENGKATSYTEIAAPDGQMWNEKWYLDKECTIEFDFDTSISDVDTKYNGSYLTGVNKNDLYLYPNAVDAWNVIFITYGSPVAPMTLPRDKKFDISSDEYKPTRDGYTFAGWYTDEELTNPATDEQAFPSDLEDGIYTVYYYAKWDAGYVPFNAMLRTENANDTNFTQATQLGTWYAIAGSTITVKTSGITHEVWCVLDGKEYPVYTDLDNKTQAILRDVYNDYFVFNDITTNDWKNVFGETQTPYTTRPISSSTVNPTVINFDYMRVRVDVITFNIPNGNNGGYIDIYKLQQNGTLTGEVNYDGNTPSTTGQNVSAHGTTAGDGISWKYTAASSNGGTNTYVLQNVKYGQRFADAYPVGISWITSKGNNQYKSYSVSGSTRAQASLLLDLAAEYMRNTGRSSSAATFTANFANDKTIGLMYAFECVDNEVADFTINGTGTSYKVNPEYCEVMNYDTNNWGDKEIPGFTFSIRQAWGVNRSGYGTSWSPYTYSLYYTDTKNTQCIITDTATTLYTVTYWKYYSSSVNGIEDFYDNRDDYPNDLYIFVYNRDRINVAFDFNYDNNGDGNNEVVTYTKLLYGQSLTSYQYAMSDGTEHQLLTRDGYRFMGWMDDKGEVYTDEDWENMILTGSDGSTMTFFAKWERISDNIIEYYESKYAAEPFEYHFFNDGDVVQYPTIAAEPEGWEWTNRQTGKTTKFGFNSPMYGVYGVREERTIDGETKTYNIIKVYGVWDNTKVKVGYDANVADGGRAEDAPIDYNEYALGDTKVPVKALNYAYQNTQGKVFVGWLLNRDGNIYQPGDHVAAIWAPSMTFTAQWVGESEVVKLIYDPNEGIPTNRYNTENKYPRGATTKVWDNITYVDEKEVPYYTRDGYRFVGWNTDKDGKGTSYAPGDQITLNADETILYAQWEPLNYNLTIEKYYLPTAQMGNKRSPLAGAEFTLSGDGLETQSITTAGDDGTATVEGLQIGTLYTLTETKAPDGFNMLTESIYFKVTTDGKVVFCEADGSELSANPDFVEGQTNFMEGNPASRTATISVKNESGSELPQTGGAGTYIYTFSGVILMTIPFMYFGYKRRKRERRA